MFHCEMLKLLSLLITNFQYKVASNQRQFFHLFFVFLTAVL